MTSPRVRTNMSRSKCDEVVEARDLPAPGEWRIVRDDRQPRRVVLVGGGDRPIAFELIQTSSAAGKPAMCSLCCFVGRASEVVRYRIPVGSRRQGDSIAIQACYGVHCAERVDAGDVTRSLRETITVEAQHERLAAAICRLVQRLHDAP